MDMSKKRVSTLYRVSTKKQVDKNEDDIPMQKIACREFIDRQGWMLVKEYTEKGISGSKVSAADRDAIQDLKESAAKGEFDVLLVFMFDRLGRIEHETPFVLQWFVENGIEVWSVKEGQQRLDSHADKLINYIRFWQAAGESEKTSIRVKERTAQMRSQGFYTGGYIPYGYKLVHKGRLNKRGEPVKDMVVDPISSIMVTTIFNKTIVDGYGSYMVAEYLNSLGYRTLNGTKFQCNTVNRILKNPIYKGDIVLTDGTVCHFEDLRIIPDDDFERAQKILQQRSKVYDEKRQICRTIKGKGMLSGNLYCAHCGHRLTTIDYKDKKKLADGTVKEYRAIKYYCYHKGRKICDCDGQTTYRADKVDNALTEIIHAIFENLSGAPEQERIERAYEQQMLANKQRQKQLDCELKKFRKNLSYLQSEIANALVGDSVYSPEDLSEAIKATKEKIANFEDELQELVNEEIQEKQSKDDLIPKYNQFKSWADEFDEATLEQKKMIACQLFNRIEIGKGYRITFEINMSYKQFIEGLSSKKNCLLNAS